MGLLEVFLDTFVICTLTALVILCSGVSVPYGVDSGGNLTVAAFSSVYGRLGNLMVFFILQTGIVIFGIVLNTPQVWRMAEILNGLMAIPNLLTLIILSPELRSLTLSYRPGVSIHTWR